MLTDEQKQERELLKKIDQYLMSDAEFDKWQRLNKSRVTRTYENEEDEFYGKIVTVMSKTHQFTHPQIDDPKSEQAKNAIYELDQCRVEEISKDDKDSKYWSLYNVGQKEPGLLVKRWIPDPTKPHIEADLIDGCTKNILQRQLEKDFPNEGKYDMPMAYVTDRKLCEFLLRNKREYQNAANETLPSESSSPASIKAAIAKRVQDAPEAIRESEQFKRQLRKMYERMLPNRPSKTIKKWIAAEYNSRKANNNGIVQYRVKSSRHETIRKALQSHSTLNVSATGWENGVNSAKPYEHEDYKIYTADTGLGTIDVYRSREDYRIASSLIATEEEDKDNRPSILIFWVANGTQIENIYKSQNDTFVHDNICATTKVRKKCFDYVFALEQQTGANMGRLLTHSDVLAEIKKIENENDKAKLKLVVNN